MSRPQQQYGFIEADENPFDEGPVAAPVRQPQPAASRPKQPRAQGQSAGSTASGAQGQARASQPRTTAASPNTQAPRTSTSTNAAPVAAAAVASAAPAVAGAAAAGAAAPAKKSVFGGMFGGAAKPAAEPLDEAALREANLRAREEKMLAKEMEVEAREREVRSKELASKNWPCRCCRILYHSIPDQIPARLQPMIRKFYILMFWTWLSLFVNMLTVIVYWGEADSDQGFIWAVAFFVMGVPGSWIMWYSNVYKGASKASGRKYVFFFIGFFFHLAICILIAIGTPTMGCGGLLVMLKAFSGSYTVSGVFALVTTAMFVINIMISLYLYNKARDAWRSGGGSEELEKDRKKMKLAGKAGMAAV